MNFIEELYYGNINPNEKKGVMSLIYKNLVKYFCQKEKKLSETLEEDNLEKFNELMNINDEISAMGNLENFKIGFALGVQMMCDCFDINKIDRE